MITPSSLKRRSTTTPTTITPFASGAANNKGESSGVGGVEDVEAEEDEIENSAASNWLESMGIDKSKFPTLNPTRVSLAQDNYKIVDGRPESLVVVEGLGNAQVCPVSQSVTVSHRQTEIDRRTNDG